MTLDKDQKIEIQQKIINKLTVENEKLKQELSSAQKKSEDVKKEYEQRIFDVESSKKEFENMINDIKEQKILLDEHMKKVKFLLAGLSSEVKSNFN